MDREFWELIDKLINSSEIVIDRPKGSKQPRYNYIYKFDYGYLKNTTSPDGGGIDVWLGSKKEKRCDSIICTIDLIKKDSEIKLLIACTELEKVKILNFHNESEFMKGIILHR